MRNIIHLKMIEKFETEEVSMFVSKFIEWVRSGKPSPLTDAPEIYLKHVALIIHVFEVSILQESYWNLTLSLPAPDI